MVFIVLISVVTLALLTLLVLGLHRYQLSIAQTNADKHNPLPPLDNIELDRELPDLSLEGSALGMQDPADFGSQPEEKPSEPEVSDEFVVADESDSTGENEVESEDDVDVDTEIIVPGPSSTDQVEIEEVQEDIGSGSLPGVLEEIEETTEAEVPVESVSDTVKQNAPQQANYEHQAEVTGTTADRELALARVEEEYPVRENVNVVIGAAAVAKTEPSFEDISGVNQTVESSISTANLAFVDPAVTAESWQDQVAELKKQDRFDEALDICRREYPLWSAYQQASLIHRAKIKLLSQANQDVSGELKALYRLAAEASFLHDRVKGLPNLSLAQLKLLDLSPVAELDMPYQKIGYTELRLIKKTDIKMLLEKWGKPESHARPRELHVEVWKNFGGDTQSTLF